ncbi:hypothetical protein [Dyadobacter sp. 3J3]|uniref:hypothetical protein n=1 Tax=Dyadobacter sp. 3J3 TaxID=2606600 RepID=UPI001358FF1C|nr:hypothetical protein [Dyadobacter sp. 3J3]
MKTALDQSTEIFKILKSDPTLAYAITGSIYKSVRPADSKLEDIVVNTIALSDGSLQKGVSNVNIHVVDLQQGPANKPFFVPNESRLQTLVEILKSILNNIYGSDFSLYIASTALIRQPEINQHYMNIRINFIFENLE